MTTDAEQLIRELIQAGKQREEIRLALISQGHETTDFETTYGALQAEQGIPDSAPAVVGQKTIERFSPVASELNDQFLPGHHFKWRNLWVLLSAVLVCGVVIILIGEYRVAIQSHMQTWFGVTQEISVTDTRLITELKRLQISANRYQKTIGEYTGVCASIGVERDVISCVDAIDAYRIFSKLSNGSHYCVDAHGYAGVVEKKILQPTSLQCR